MKLKAENLVYIAWLQAVFAMLGSLFFSEVMGLPPCLLCWYQRICLYPLVAILLVGMIRKNKDIAVYVLPLSIIGELIAIYHNLLYYKILPESIAPCTAGVSCTTKFFEWFGFITIPLLSLAAFTLINICMILVYKMNSSKK